MITLLLSGSGVLGLVFGPLNLRVEADQKEAHRTSLGGTIKGTCHLVPMLPHAELALPATCRPALQTIWLPPGHGRMKGPLPALPEGQPPLSRRPEPGTTHSRLPSSPERVCEDPSHTTRRGLWGGISSQERTGGGKARGAGNAVLNPLPWLSQGEERRPESPPSPSKGRETNRIWSVGIPGKSRVMGGWDVGLQRTGSGVFGQRKG